MNSTSQGGTATPASPAGKTQKRACRNPVAGGYIHRSREAVEGGDRQADLEIRGIQRLSIGIGGRDGAPKFRSFKGLEEQFQFWIHRGD